MPCRGWLSTSLLPFLITWLLLTASTAFANAVGKITLDQYAIGQGDLNSGIQMTAHYSITDPKGLANCCDTKNLRWMQLVDSSHVESFTPRPDNRPFIDPRKGQPGGNRIGDGLPYYDSTYLKDPNTFPASPNLGVGPYIYDPPQVPNMSAQPNQPYTFKAETILVCITKPDGKPIQLTILGGFEWGFQITDTLDKRGKDVYSATALKPTGLSDSPALEAQFNTALNFDFPGYQLVPCKDTVCGDNTFNFVSPEPCSLLFLGSGILGVGGFLRRRLRT
jgi:hypothetical protein